MITVKINKKDDKLIGFDIAGHALSGERDFTNDSSLVGEAFDIICNSVSVLSQSAVIGIDEVLKLNCAYEIDDGFLSLQLKECLPEEMEKAQIVLETFEKSLESVIAGFDQLVGEQKRKEYIIIKKEEV